MPAAKNKTQNIHDLLPVIYNSQHNPNWKTVVDSLGQQDEETAKLIEEVRKQLFIKSASRPYIDRIASNHKVSRPRFIGMDDQAFRKYVPVLAYTPKQVKLILDQLLDLFFFKESTTSYTESFTKSPFTLKDGWELEYKVDNIYTERIEFKQEDFVNISQSTAEELVSAINRQAKRSFAVVKYDSVTKTKTVRLFTNTIGSKGSVFISGGRANISCKFDGFIHEAATGSDTQWEIAKVGDLVTFKHVGGQSPSLNALEKGCILVSDIPGNSGSFEIKNIDLESGSFTFKNLFGEAGNFNQTNSDQIKFLRPHVASIYKNPKRAVVWEVQNGEVVIEMPASPPVVRRELKGSAHLNGTVSTMKSYVSSSSLELEDASQFPASGNFWLEEKQEIKTVVSPNGSVVSTTINSRLIGKPLKYAYSGKSGNTLTGITPALPSVSAVIEVAVTGGARADNQVTINTQQPHGLKVGQGVVIQNVEAQYGLTTPVNGTYSVFEVLGPSSFKYLCPGDNGVIRASSQPGSIRVEKFSLASAGSRVVLTSAQTGTGITGPFIYSETAPFVLSSLSAKTMEPINAGDIAKLLAVSANGIPNEDCFVILNYGTQQQEGPIRCLYKPADNSLFLDPSYTFQKSHKVNSTVTMIRRKGAHALDPSGKDLPAYITDTASAREILQDLVKAVKSAGIFIKFLVRYPDQLYASVDVYRSGVDPDFKMLQLSRGIITSV